MSVTFLDLYSELTASVRVIDVSMAMKCTNRAWTDIGKAYEWSWLRTQTALSAPDAIDTGTVSIDQFSRDLTFDATATAILDALGLNVPLTTRSIKIDGGSPYQIASYTPGGTATLDPNGPPYQEESAVAASFSIFKSYYQPPADFGRWISIRDPVSNYELAWGANLTQELLDTYDPQRMDTSQPWGLFSAYAKREIDANGATTSFTPRWEMWPRPVVARGYQATYRRRNVDFVNDDDSLPDSLDSDVVLWGAKVRAYMWAAENQAGQAQLAGTNWLNMMATAQIKYKEALRDAIIADRNVFPNLTVYRRRRFNMASPSWLQSHDLIGEGGNYGYFGGGSW